MPPINWNAINSLSRAKIGQSHPIKDSPFSNPAVQQIARDERVNSLAEAKVGTSPALNGSPLSNPAVQQQMQNLAQSEQQPGCMFVAKNALNGGELSPMLSGRFDQPRYLTGCKLLRNMIAMPQGGITRRPGMEFLGSIGGAVNSMFIPFVFSATEACMLELAAEEGRDTSGLNVWLADGTLYRGGILSLPYAAGEVHELSYAQSADTLYLAHSNHPPAKLMRYGMDDWRYEVIDWMPDIAAPAAPTISWEGNPGEWSWQRELATYKYVVTAVDKTSGDESEPSAEAKIENCVPVGTNGYYIVLTVQPVPNAGEYRVYKKQGGGYGFVGRITDVDKSPLTFEDRNITPDTADTPPEPRDPWNDPDFPDDGYPALVFFHHQRLCFARTYKRPMTIWMSQSGIYESMAAATPPLDDHAIEVTMAATQCNRILWCCSDRNVLCIGTEGGEWILTGAEGDVLTPSNLMFQPQTYYGSAPLGQDAIRAASSLLFVQFGAKSIREFCYTFQSDSYQSADLSVLARHILDPSIIFAAWQGDPYNILWCVLADGTMAAVTYLKDQEVVAWHRHDTDGLIKDIAALPDGKGQTQIWMHVERNGVRCVERLRPYKEVILTEPVPDTDYTDGPWNAPYESVCIPHLPETTLQNGSTYMRVRKLNAVKAQVVNCKPFVAKIGDGPWMNVPERLPNPDYTGGPTFWNLPIAGGWRENADLALKFTEGPATVLGILATLELADLAGSQG